jgi:mannosyl-oligosaccharide alpha-1,2-mannosidase
MLSPFARRWIFLCILVFTSLSLYLKFSSTAESDIERLTRPHFFRPAFSWKDVPIRHPVANLTPLPTGPLVDIPRVQHAFELEQESEDHMVERQRRLAAVKKAFIHSWEGYKENAWMQDEVAPLSGEHKNGFGGWGATLVDSLDTLWIMGMEKEFELAVNELRKVHFTTMPLPKVNVFETTIRYLGGLMSAYDLSGQKYEVLLEKATELGEMLYAAFDTPNRMPMARWNWRKSALGESQEADRRCMIAEVGSLSMEFTRLSQLTRDPKWYDAIARITDVFETKQSETKVPGLWPVYIDAINNDFHWDTTFTLGGMADSAYEYLPKQHLMLGGRTDQYRKMYDAALAAAKEVLFYRVLNPENKDILVPGTYRYRSKKKSDRIPSGQHLTCFAGGMVALASRIFSQPEDLETARQLVEGCLWSYESMPSGVGAETFTPAICAPANSSLGFQAGECLWSEENWHRAILTHSNSLGDVESLAERAQIVIDARKLAPGFVSVDDTRYLLRPEAIESVFVLYRITGDKTLQDRAWKMFSSINAAAKTDIAYASIVDVTAETPELFDSMESFWTAETLKYFYLIFAEPDVVSLDEYVL